MSKPASEFRKAATVSVAASLFGALCQPALARDADYSLRYGDAIGVTVVGHPELSVPTQPIRPDGQVALPLVPDLPAAGRTIPELTAAITAAYRPYLQKPQVVISLTRIRPLKVTVLGQVGKPGTFDFDEEPDLADALAVAGGLTRRAARDHVKVVAPGQAPRVYDIDALLGSAKPLPRLREDTVVDASEVWYPDGYVLIPAIASVLASTTIIARGWPF
ncbi:MAG: polysaccharide export protein [Candidatus Sericytochromatia bacterium]|nr:polysaccharide export protein [Candidatus Tanganyikabacteria bacterium]